MAVINQIAEIVNDAYKDALGVSTAATPRSTTDFVSMGEQLKRTTLTIFGTIRLLTAFQKRSILCADTKLSAGAYSVMKQNGELLSRKYTIILQTRLITLLLKFRRCPEKQERIIRVVRMM